MAKNFYYTVSEAAKKLKVSRQAIHDAITTATPPRLKSSRQTIKKTIVKTIEVIVISDSDLEKYKETISRSHQERGKKNCRNLTQ